MHFATQILRLSLLTAIYFVRMFVRLNGIFQKKKKHMMSYQKSDGDCEVCDKLNILN